MTGKLSYKFQRYGAIFRELKNWPTYLAFKLGIHPGKDFVFRFRDGNIYKVPKKMIGPFRECFFDDQYLLHFNKSEFPSQPTILDIGANVGYAALYFFRCFPNAEIHSFEPMPFLQNILRQQNELYSNQNWHQHQYGLWNKDGEMEIFTDAPNEFTSISGIAHYEDAIHKVSIPVRTLAGFLDSHHMNKINLLKMDCEGAEYEILMALPESYFAKIEKIAMETHITQAYKTEDMAEFLLSKGYQVKYVTRQKTRTGHVWAWK